MNILKSMLSVSTVKVSTTRLIQPFLLIQDNGKRVPAPVRFEIPGRELDGLETDDLLKNWETAPHAIVQHDGVETIVFLIKVAPQPEETHLRISADFGTFKAWCYIPKHLTIE